MFKNHSKHSITWHCYCLFMLNQLLEDQLYSGEDNALAPHYGPNSAKNSVRQFSIGISMGHKQTI